MLKGYNNAIKAEGQVYYSPYEGKIVNNINCSDIFSELIQAAGMGCEYYASDLFYDLVTIRDYVDNNKSGVFYIGIRDMGVDGNSFIKSRLNKGSCNYEPNCYIKLYRLEIIVTEKEITMELKREDERTAFKELCEICKEENV